MFVNFVGRFCLSLCCAFCCEFMLLAIVGSVGIGNGRGAEGLGDFLLSFLIGSIVVFPAGFYLGWRITDCGHKIS